MEKKRIKEEENQGGGGGGGGGDEEEGDKEEGDKEEEKREGEKMSENVRIFLFFNMHNFLVTRISSKHVESELQNSQSKLLKCKTCSVVVVVCDLLYLLDIPNLEQKKFRS